MRETRPEELSSRTSPTGFTHPSILPAAPSDIHQYAQWRGKWHIKRPHNRPLRRTQGHLWCKQTKILLKGHVTYTQRRVKYTWKVADEKTLPQTLASLHLPRRRHRNRALLFPQMREQEKKKKKLQWSELDGTDGTHLSLRHFTR